jgi:CBS domain-containing protein
MYTLEFILANKDHSLQVTTPEATVLDAVDEMCRARVGALLVVKRGAPVGMLSERDLLTRVLMHRLDPATTRVADIMTRDVVCVGLHVEPEEAMAVMTSRRCRHLPVVVDGRVVGIVSIGDLVRWASENRDHEIRMLTDLVSGRYPS